MAAVADGLVAVDDMFAAVMGGCLQCRACEAVCPSMVPFGRAMEGARAELAVQNPARYQKTRRFLVGWVLETRWLMRALTGLAAFAQRLRIDRVGLGPFRRLRHLRRLRLIPPTLVGMSWRSIGDRHDSVALLAGCVMDPWFEDVHVATINVLRRAGIDVQVPSDQTCCGALASHDGAADDAVRMAARNIAAFAGTGTIVVNAAGCGAHLKDYRAYGEPGAELAGRVRDVTEVVAEMIEVGQLPVLDEPRGPVAVQDPCHLRHAQGVVDPPRAVLRAAGHEIREIDASGTCCGAAGIYSLLQPDTADELGRRKATETLGTGAPVVAAANPGCELQLRQHLTAAGSAVRVAHPIELYWEALRRVRP
jgi:glycolate oxidase iron-sulfur subunit